MNESVRRQDYQARVGSIHQQHQRVVERRVGRRLGMLAPHLILEVERRFVAVMAIGDVEG